MSGEFSDAKAEYVLNYTNNLIKLTKNGERYYFKEARERLGLRDYIDRSVINFFSEVCADDDLERQISQSLKHKKNLKKLIRMGEKDDVRSPLHRYLTEGDAQVLGLPPFSDGHQGIGRQFVFYIYGELNNYALNYGVRKGNRQTFLAVRAVAVKKLADILGIGHLVPETRYVKLCLGDRERYGTLEWEAAGFNVAGVPPEERKKHITPQFLRELTNLNVLDVLCHDDDHRANNFHTVANERGEYVGVVSYDNDGPNVFLPSVSIRFGNGLCSAFIGRHGLVARPHLDRRLAEAVLRLDRSAVGALAAYLTLSQRMCLWRRIRKMQKAILKTQRANAAFLLDEWTEEQIQEELSGRFGKTYLQSFLSDCYYHGGAHPYDIC